MCQLFEHKAFLVLLLNHFRFMFTIVNIICFVICIFDLLESQFFFCTTSSALRDLEIHQMDVKSAFLKEDLENEIYMKQPEGFEI